MKKNCICFNHIISENFKGIVNFFHFFFSPSEMNGDLSAGGLACMQAGGWVYSMAPPQQK